MATPPETPLRDLLLACRALATDAERRAFLDRACGGDAGLRSRVEILLAGGAEEARPAAGDEPSPPPSDELPGARVGRYRLVERIGEGGFGTVWMAEQTEPVTRRVALKILKLGMDTRQVVARFERERQALALMEHPNIAKVFDAGATPSGRPYFVMELVDGVPILEYCDGARLDTAARLALFVDVCHAIQHAHQKGIIHRDIKPSNVLVTRLDGRPVPKVIDFGIAKATGAETAARTVFTEQRQMIGTPAYMSPEQAGTTGLDVDTRSDIYSLGVLLYELLTGTTPFDVRELLEKGFAEMLRTIREVEPHKPSTRISTLGDTAALTALRRNLDVKKLGSLLRGDLDWIVMRCLERDRARRYESAVGLGADIERFLAGEPVTAAPPSAAYRLRKLVRRHRGPAIAAGVVLAALLCGLAGTLWQATVASRERDSARFEARRADERAEAAERAETGQRRLAAAEAEQRAEAEKQKAAADAAAAAEKARADELQQVAEFQVAMLRQIDVTAAGTELMRDLRSRFDAALGKAALSEADRAARGVTFASDLAAVNATDAAVAMIDRTILKPGVRAVDSRFGGQPVVDAALRQTLSDVYLSLGRPADARPLAERALGIRRSELGDDHPHTLRSVLGMGHVLRALGLFAEAMPFYREALDTARREFGEEHSETLLCISNMGGLLRALGRDRDAEPYLREVLEKRRALLGEEHPLTLEAISSLGGVLDSMGRLDDAEPCYREVLEKRRRVLGEEHRDTIASIAAMATFVAERGRFAEAEAMAREALDKCRRVHGDEHPVTIASVGRMETILRARGRLAEAEPYAREALESRRRVLGPDHPDTIASIASLGRLLADSNRPAEAEPNYREALGRSHAALGAEHPSTLTYAGNLGLLLQSQGRLSEAEPFVSRVLEARRRVLGADHPDTVSAVNNLGVLHAYQGRPADAEPLLRECLERYRRLVGDGHVITLTARNNLGATLIELSRHEEALAFYAEAAEGLERMFGKTHARTAQARMGTGRALTGLGRYPEAEAALLEAERAMSAAEGVAPANRAKCLAAIVALYERWHEREPGRGHDDRAAEWRARMK